MPEPSQARPCIVLGVETQIGLSIVRELGAAGVPVIAMSHDPHALGLASRHVWRKVIAGPPRSEAVLAAVRAIGQQYGSCSLITVSEANLLWLSAHRADLGCVAPALPPAQALAAVLDKQLTLQAARAVGIQVPRTDAPTSFGAIAALAGDFPLPAVLKWADPNAVSAALAVAGLELIKAEYVYTTAELMAAAQRYRAIGQWPLIQQYCPGRGLGQFFFVHQGQVARRFQHLRIAEWPPEGGFSSVCDALPLACHADLQALSAALLQRIGWEGVAMVEYRLDEATGQAVLMEINGRFWGSLPLAMHAGAGFALLAHHAALGEPLPTLPPPRNDLRCRMVMTEIKRLVRLLLRPQAIKDRRFKVRPLPELRRFVLDFFRPKVRYYVWLLRDPKPFLVDVANGLFKWRQAA